MKIHTLRALKDNFIFVLQDEDRAAVVDPGEAAVVRRFLQEHKLHLTHILCTHHHHDHIGGVQELKAEFKASVLCSELDFARIHGADRGLIEGETLEICGEHLKVLTTPGHTLGQIALWFAGANAVFVGDTLFSCGCGRLFEGTHLQMWQSLQRLSQLPPETQIYFGHEYTMNNIEFLQRSEANSAELNDYKRRCQIKLTAGEPTVPTTVSQELVINPLFAAPNVETFRHWRGLRDTWASLPLP